MKRILAVFLTALTVLSFGVNSIDKAKEETRELVRELSMSLNKQSILTTLFSSDVILKEIAIRDKKFNIQKLVLIFPDIKYIKEYMPKVLDSVDYVELYIIDGKVDKKHLDIRDFEDYEKEKIDDVLRATQKTNFIVIRVKMDDKDIEKLVDDSLNKSIRDKNSILYKYFNGQYEYR